MNTSAGIGRIFDIVIDVSDLDRAAAFWSAALGARETYRGGPYVVLATEAGQMLTLQKVPEAKEIKNRMHLDIAVPDVDVAMEQIIGLGGSRVSQWGEGNAVAASSAPTQTGTNSVWAQQRAGATYTASRGLAP